MRRFPPAGCWPLAVGLTLLLAGLACRETSPSESVEERESSPWQQQVTIVSYPLHEALSTVVGEHLLLFHPDVPTGKAMDRETARRVQASRLIVVDGTHHAGWVDTVTLPESRKRLSTFEIMDQLIMVDNLGSHSHGPGGEHSHKGIVAQSWLDPALFQQQLRSVLQACVRAELLPADRVEPALAAWEARMVPVEQKIQTLAGQPARRVMADQAGTEYLFRRLGWTVEIQELGNLLQTDAGLLERELAERHRADPTLVVALTQVPNPALIQMLEKLDIPTILVDLIETAGPVPYPDRLEENLKNIEKVALIPF